MKKIEKIKPILIAAFILTSALSQAQMSADSTSIGELIQLQTMPTAKTYYAPTMILNLPQPSYSNGNSNSGGNSGGSTSDGPAATGGLTDSSGNSVSDGSGGSVGAGDSSSSSSD